MNLRVAAVAGAGVAGVCGIASLFLPWGWFGGQGDATPAVCLDGLGYCYSQQPLFGMGLLLIPAGAAAAGTCCVAAALGKPWARAVGLGGAAGLLVGAAAFWVGMGLAAHAWTFNLGAGMAVASAACAVAGWWLLGRAPRVATPGSDGPPNTGIRPPVPGRLGVVVGTTLEPAQPPPKAPSPPPLKTTSAPPSKTPSRSQPSKSPPRAPPGRPKG